MDSVRATELNVNSFLLDQLLELLGHEALGQGNWAFQRAAERARTHVAAGISWTLRGDVLTVASASTEDVEYTLTLEQGCECQAQQGVCWHRALLAAAISAQTLLAALTTTQPLVPPTPIRRAARAPRVALDRPMDPALRARIDALKARMTPDEIAASLAA